MSIYSELQSVASDIFAEFNQGTVRHIQVLSGTGSGDDPGAASEVTRDIAATVRSAGASKSGAYFIKNGLAVASDMLVSTGVSTVPFAIGDFISIDGERHKIVSIVRKPEAGTVVAYTLIVRK